MKVSHLVSVIVAVLFSLPTLAWGQDTALVLETAFDGVSSAVQDRFRESLHAGLNSSAHYTVLTEGASRQRLGDDADRLMACGDNASCLSEAAATSGARVGVAASVSEAGEIYTFTVDVYELETGAGLFYTDAECVLCTVDEALGSLRELGEAAAGAFPGSVAATTTLYIRVEPEDAAIWVNGDQLGEGALDLEAEAGDYVLRVDLAGYQTVETEIHVAVGDDDKEITVRLREEEGGTAGRSGGSLTGSDTTVLGSVFVGTGLVAAVTGIVLIAIDGNTTCSEGAIEDCPDIFETSAGGTALTVVGAATLTAGIFFLLWDTLAGDPVPESTDTAFGVGATPDGAGFVFSTTF